MKNAIFYSWQSDLPNGTNRSFLETCLNQVLENLRGIGDFQIELNIDRDTRNEAGSPDIVSTIFKKIDSAKLFVADISIINPKTDFRKTPNPNVLLELGYAAKSLGWSKVICLYNKDYGDFEDLPFDLKQRRPIAYSIERDGKAGAKKQIVTAITETIKILAREGALHDEVSDYFKVQVDTEILSITNHLNKICFDYEKPFSLRSVSDFLDLTNEQISAKLTSREFLGFQIFKRWNVNEKKLQEIANTLIVYPHHGREIATIIIQLIKWVGAFDAFNTTRKNPNLFMGSGNTDQKYKILAPSELNQRNDTPPDRFVLLKKIDDSKGVVVDFGDFIEHDKINGLIMRYRLNPEFIELYMMQIRHFISITEKWLDATNGEFIIDNFKNFELHHAKATRDL